MPYFGNVLTSFNVGTNNINNEAITSEKIAAGAVVNADVNDTASIAGTKISADFGAQDLIVDTNLLFVDVSTDRVGIGTSSPAVPLEVRATQADLRLVSDAGGFAQLQFGDANDAIRGGVVFDCTNDLLLLRSHNNETAVAIDSSERVGIGTTSPGKKLEITPGSNQDGILIKNTGTVFGALEFDANRSGTAESLGDIRFLWNGTATARIIGVTGSDTTNKDDAHLTFWTANAGSPTEKVRIDSSGRLSVGVSNFAGNARVAIRGDINSDTNGGRLAFVNSTTISSGSRLGLIEFGNQNGNTGAMIGGYGDGNWAANDYPGFIGFFTTAAGNSSSAERMRITSSGQLSTGGETAPDVGGGGLCLDQNDGDGIILSFKSSDIDHGITNLDETDTYFSVRKFSGDKGGVRFRAYTDAAGGDPAMAFNGVINSDSDTNYVPFTFLGGKKSGTGGTNISSNRRIIDFKNYDGTRIASFTGTGLTFGNDDAVINALDDYEEGTWTADLQCATNNNGGLTFTSSTGTYIKIGKLCFISIFLQWSGSTRTGGNLQLTGLPFTQQTSNAHRGGFYITYSNAWTGFSAAYDMTIRGETNSTVARFQYGTGSGNNNNEPGGANLTTGLGSIMITGSYEVA